MALVYSTSEGEVFHERRPLGWLHSMSSTYRVRYEVDILDHRCSVDLSSEPLPTGDGHVFRATVDVAFRVHDPAEVVRSYVVDAIKVVSRAVADVLRVITRDYRVDQAGDAEEAIRAAFHTGVQLPEGITIFEVWPQLQIADPAQSPVPGSPRSAEGHPEYGVFLSYRREEASAYARLLKHELQKRFPGSPVFMDLDSIEPGQDFVEAIEAAVKSCKVFLVLIGRRWLTFVGEDGNRRVDDPEDYVRFEIRVALEHGMRIIPVLLDGAQAPRAPQLPEDLARLARLNAIDLTHGRYDYDADRLMQVIEPLLASGPRPPAG